MTLKQIHRNHMVQLRDTWLASAGNVDASVEGVPPVVLLTLEARAPTHLVVHVSHGVPLSEVLDVLGLDLIENGFQVRAISVLAEGWLPRWPGQPTGEVLRMTTVGLDEQPIVSSWPVQRSTGGEPALGRPFHEPHKHGLVTPLRRFLRIVRASRL